MSGGTTIACGICERPVHGVPSDAGRPVVCWVCALNPGLVRAFREGFAQGEADAKAANKAEAEGRA